MNGDREQARAERIELLRGQIEGLERWIAEGRDDPHLLLRLEHTRAELEALNE